MVEIVPQTMYILFHNRLFLIQFVLKRVNFRREVRHPLCSIGRESP